MSLRRKQIAAMLKPYSCLASSVGQPGKKQMTLTNEEHCLRLNEQLQALETEQIEVVGRLDAIQREKQRLLSELEALKKCSLNTSTISSFPDAAVNNSSSIAAKIALFRSLFRGREDVS